tara:strand:+ start:355 stop:657 length:303 start_codon:yes stop_codon:yes gene_type:complete
MENKLLFSRVSATDMLALPAREVIAIAVDTSTELKIWFAGLDVSDNAGEMEVVTTDANARTAIKAIVHEINYGKTPMSTVADEVDGAYLSGITAATSNTN